jgi:hypothetical protein
MLPYKNSRDDAQWAIYGSSRPEIGRGRTIGSQDEIAGDA